MVRVPPISRAEPGAPDAPTPRAPEEPARVFGEAALPPTRPSTRIAPRAFTGPAISPEEFPPRTARESETEYQDRLHRDGDRMEREFLRAQGPGLACYGPFDASLEPVILVHGYSDSPGDMMAIAERLRSQGRQAFFYMYDDRHDALPESGRGLARALRQLRGCYPPGQDLSMIAHSMGNLVTRLAFTTLSKESNESERRAGFTHIKVTSADAIWGGAPHGLPDVLADAFGLWPMSEVDSSSEVMRDLHLLPLPYAVTFRNITADTHDRHLRLSDLSMEELQFLGSAMRRMDIEGFAFERAPGPHNADALRNFILALREDVSFAALRTQLVAAAHDGATVLRIIRGFMPAIATTHHGMLFDPAALDALTAR